MTILQKYYKLIPLTQKLILLDIDGTLANAEGYVPPSALIACREARRQGHILYICSGRARTQIRREIMAIGFDGIASAGGAHIETGNTAGDEPYLGDVIFDAVMPPLLVQHISGFLNSRQCGFSFEKNSHSYANRYYISHWESIIDYLIAGGKSQTDLSLYINELKNNTVSGNPKENNDASVFEGVCKMMFVMKGSTTIADIKKDFGEVCEIFLGSIPYLGDENGEIGPLGIHKGYALEKIAGHHGIPLADTIAFGDSDNDHKMLLCAGTGVAMGNATDALKAIADEITSSLEEDGIYNGFKKLALI